MYQEEARCRRCGRVKPPDQSYQADVYCRCPEEREERDPALQSVPARQP